MTTRTEAAISPSEGPGPAPPTYAGQGVISVEGLGHRFGDKIALQDGLNLTLGPGGVVGLLGPNGSGKSTLMRILVGLVPKQMGTAVVDGATLLGDGLAVRKRVTYAPGELHLYGEMKGSEHLKLLLRGRGHAAVEKALSIAAGLDLPLHRRVRGYSHGMKRQLLFAASMGPDVRVRILDEISEGLDPTKRSQILGRIEEDADSGTTILLSSHHLAEIDRACKRIVFLNDGRIIADEDSEAVRQRAARVIKIRFAEGSEGLIEAKLQGDDVERVDVEGNDVRVLLREEDPRPFLGRLSGIQGLSAPQSVEHGKLSLRELYRSLYGVEGT